MSEDVETLIDTHRVRGTSRRWESNGTRPWDRCTVIAGELDDGRWYVERHHHPDIGPAKARTYDTKSEALDVARKVMANASRKLDGRLFVAVDGH